MVLVDIILLIILSEKISFNTILIFIKLWRVWHIKNDKILLKSIHNVRNKFINSTGSPEYVEYTKSNNYVTRGKFCGRCVLFVGCISINNATPQWMTERARFESKGVIVIA